MISSFTLFWLNSYCSHFSIISFEKSLPSFGFGNMFPKPSRQTISAFFFLPLLPRQHFPHCSNSTSSCVCAICSGPYITHCKAELFHLLRMPRWPPKSISINQNKIRKRAIKTMQLLAQLQISFQSPVL